VTDIVDEFEEFVEEEVPACLTAVIEQVRDEWDGSPILLLAIPEHPEVDAYVITAENAILRLSDIHRIVTATREVPVACAYVTSSRLIRPTGVTEGEGMLSIFCADENGRQAASFKRLSTDENDRMTVDDLPADVQSQMLSGVTTGFIRDLLKMCGEVRAGRVEYDSDEMYDVLTDALVKLDN
jgi:hypothetical protein